jgi:hypothetical protein
MTKILLSMSSGVEPDSYCHELLDLRPWLGCWIGAMLDQEE